jgi:hypothetical protein
MLYTEVDYHRSFSYLTTMNKKGEIVTQKELPLLELLETLLGPEGRRRLKLRYMTNDGVFQLYDSDLVLRLHNAKNLSATRITSCRGK